jgi:hypothetical protein
VTVTSCRVLEKQRSTSAAADKIDIRTPQKMFQKMELKFH